MFPASVAQQSNSSYSATDSKMADVIAEVFKEDKMETNEMLFDKVSYYLFYDIAIV